VAEREAPTRVAVVGGGTIGVGWAIVFARAGIDVALYEPDRDRRSAVRGDFESRLATLDRAGLLTEDLDAIGRRATVAEDLREAVSNATHVQECTPESLELKRAVFAELELLVPPDAVLASSSSAITTSEFASALASRDRCLVAHPGNPPYLLPVVELVPAPFTSETAVERAQAVFASAGMAPVVIRREVEGFVFNRLQGAILREAYCLVRDGVVSAGDVDTVVRDGLGRRMAVLGPFETAELNTRGGIEAHAQRLGPAYARMGAERGQHDPWTPELVADVAADLHRRLPPEEWDANVARRDARLAALESARRESGLF
jgi:L-gulonate 3-dehydrogenase